LVGEITLQLGLVELRDQILAGSATPEAATKEENGLRSWIRAKLRGLNLGKYGTSPALTATAPPTAWGPTPNV